VDSAVTASSDDAGDQRRHPQVGAGGGAGEQQQRHRGHQTGRQAQRREQLVERLQPLDAGRPVTAVRDLGDHDPVGHADQRAGAEHAGAELQVAVGAHRSGDSTTVRRPW
jgi:hypothetical protein